MGAEREVLRDDKSIVGADGWWLVGRRRQKIWSREGAEHNRAFVQSWSPLLEQGRKLLAQCPVVPVGCSEEGAFQVFLGTAQETFCRFLRSSLM